MKKYSLVRSGVGAPSILMIIVILLLATFAVLSLSTANADRKLYQANLEYTKSYYLAEQRVQQQLRDLSNAVQNSLDSERISVLFSDDSDLTIAMQGSTIAFSVPIDERQSIAVVCVIDKKNDSQYFLRIDSHTVVNTDEWEVDQEINLWKEE